VPNRPLLADEGFKAPDSSVFQPKHWFDVDLGPIHFYMNKATGLALFAALFVAVVFWLGFRRARIVPRGVQNVCESLYEFIDRSVALDIIGQKGRKYTPYLVVLFSYVLICNVLAIVPVAQFPATSRIAVPMVLALITWVMFNVAGIRANGARRYFGEMINPAPTAPMWIKVILGPIELLSTLIVRPFTLAVRLFANMFAGHMLLLIFSEGATYLLPKPPFVFGAVSLLVAFVLTGFELIIDVLQAYIITVLTAAYVAGATAEHEHEAAYTSEAHEAVPESEAVPIAAPAPATASA
jgi:F-type H+-transporting ATPase subunit a